MAPLKAVMGFQQLGRAVLPRVRAAFRARRRGGSGVLALGPCLDAIIQAPYVLDRMFASVLACVPLLFRACCSLVLSCRSWPLRRCSGACSSSSEGFALLFRLFFFFGAVVFVCLCVVGARVGAGG